jgi:hypothetical protein
MATVPVSDDPPMSMARVESPEPISSARTTGTDPVVVLSETED